MTMRSCFSIFSVHETMTPRAAHSKILHSLLVPVVLSVRHKKYSFFVSVVRVKMVGKIPENSGSVFPYFLVIFVLFDKYGNRYENGIWCCGNRSEYD
jgi:hypothetical protein